MPVVVRAQYPFVGIDGTALSEQLRREIVEVWVDDHLVLPDSVYVRFRFDQPDLWDRLRVGIGQELEIRSGELGESADATLIKAEVTSVEAVFEEGTRFLVIRGYDASHRLHIGKKTRSFNNVTDSDLARRIAGDAGLDIGTIDSTSVVHEHVSQINTTDWDFLRSRAEEIGFTVAVRDGSFSFSAADSGGGGGGGLGGAAAGALGLGGGVELTVGDGLIHLRTRVTGAQQVTAVTARGWDMARKQAVSHEASAETTSVTLEEPGWSPGELADVFGGQPYLTCERPIASSDEARDMAESVAAGIASTFAEAEGTAEGNPRIITGGTITIGGSGPFDGDYVVSHTRHRFDDDGYHTDFEIAGAQERSLLGLTTLGATRGGAPPIFGAVIGLVTNIQDPEMMGRIKLKFPWLGDDYESDWARVALPGAGAERGFLCLPEVDDEVLVMFERGDMRRPYVIGGLYNGVDSPPSTQYYDDSDGAMKSRKWVSTEGHKISLSDWSDEADIIIESKDTEYGIAMSKHHDEVRIFSSGKIMIESRGDIELAADGDIKVEARGALELKGSTAKLEASGQTDVKGGIVKIN